MPAPERALRRLVANLARAGEEDIDAVMSGLEPRHRTAVEALLASCRGEPKVTQPPSPASPDPIIIQGLSPWLMARLERRTQSSTGRAGAFGELVDADAREAGLAYTMTQVAFETLQACAASLEETPASPRPRRLRLGGRAL